MANMGNDSVLIWSGKATPEYREARRQIATRNGIAPKTEKSLDFADFFQNNPNHLVYYPVVIGTTGWWGELLETDAKIQAKIIVSPECQLYEIGLLNTETAHNLYAAEFVPKAGILQKLRDGANAIRDMIATESGAVLALMSGNELQIKRHIRAGGGEFFGRLGGY